MSYEGYAKGRVREDQLDQVRPLVGDEVADNIGNFQFIQEQTTGKFSQAFDYIAAPVKTALHWMHDTSSRFRGLIAKKKWEPATGADVTGLEQTPITHELQEELLHGPWYMQAFPGLAMVKQPSLLKNTANWAAELATDPFMLAGSAGVGAKAVLETGAALETKAAIEAVKAVEKAKIEKVTARQAQAKTEAPSSGEAGASVAPSTSVPKPDKYLDLFKADPSLEYVGRADVPTNRITLGHPVDDPAAIERAIQYGERYKAGEQVDDLVLVEGEQGYETLSGAGRTIGLGRAGKETVGADIFRKKADKNLSPAEKVEQEEVRNAVSTKKADDDAWEKHFEAIPEGVQRLDFDVEQSILPGFGRYVRQEQDKAKIAGAAHLPAQQELDLAAEGTQRVIPGMQGHADELARQAKREAKAKQAEVEKKVPDRKQMGIIWKETINPEKLVEDARHFIDNASITDKQTLAAARQLLEENVVNPFSIAHKKGDVGFKLTKKQAEALPSGIPEQAYVAASAAVERSVVGRFDEIVEAFVKDPSPANLERAIIELANAKQVTARLSADAAERAAALRIESTRQAPEVQALEALIKDLPKGTTPERMMYAYRQLKTDAEKATFLKGLMGTKSGIKGNLLSLMLNSMLSTSAGVAVGMGNITAGAALFGTKLAERAMMSRFTNEVAHGEAGVMAYSFVKSYMDLMTSAFKLDKELNLRQGMVKKEFSARWENTMERFAGNDPYALRRNLSGRTIAAGDSWYSYAVDLLGYGMRVPSFMVGTTDAILGFAVKQANMEALAYREATMQAEAAMRLGKITNKSDFAKVVNTRREELLADTSQMVRSEGKLSSLNEIGENESALINMMKPIREGTIGAKIQGATEHSLGFRALVPFFRVQYHTAAEAVYRAPVVNMFNPKLVSDFRAGGELRAKAMAQTATGFALGAVTGVLAHNGVLVADGPADPEMRADYLINHKPGLNVGNTVIPFEKFGAIGNVMRFIANAHYMLPRLADSEHFSSELTLAVSSILTSLVSDQRLNKDFSDLMSTLALRDGNGVLKWLEEAPTRMIPYQKLLSQIDRQIKGYTTVADGPWQKMLAALPGQTAGFKYYNEIGEVNQVPDWYSWEGMGELVGAQTNRANKPETNRVLETLAKHRVTVSGPARVQGPDIRLTLEEYMDLRRLYGSVKGPGGATMMQELEALTKNPSFLSHNGKPTTDGPYGLKQNLVDKVTSAYKKAAWNELLRLRTEDGKLKYPSLRTQIEAGTNWKLGVDKGIEIRR